MISHAIIANSFTNRTVRILKNAAGKSFHSLEESSFLTHPPALKTFTVQREKYKNMYIRYFKDNFQTFFFRLCVMSFLFLHSEGKNFDSFSEPGFSIASVAAVSVRPFSVISFINTF